MAKYPSRKPISLILQFAHIKQKYSNVDLAHSGLKNNEMRVRLQIKPTEDSENYIVDIIYKQNLSPKVLLISPQLGTYNGKKPHHLYGEINGHPQLCLYYPKNKEWTRFDYIADTIIPWISTWLFAYEYWLITGNWNYAEVNGKKVKD